ncbi:glycine zipper family protein [Maricaulis sp. D1M11]|uniref:glycine zipper family protein n=1 Tax=Maricaulis sp. D1M11 TaxID=3076117 RepID=UPI0039B4FC51
MKSRLLPLCLSTGLLATACANTGATYSPIVDGPVGPNYRADLAACQQIATERGYLNDDVRTDALIGAGIGAVAGVLDDEVDDTEGAVTGAVVGAIAGGGARMNETRGERRQIVIDCMQGRGHAVVG